MEHLRIGIIGNIGVGKSTLVEAASSAPLKQILLDLIPTKEEHTDVHAFQEEFNPKVLDEFYKDPVANAFLAQIEFFNGRLDRQRQIAGCHGIVLEDRTLAEDYHIFGMAQKVQGNMSEAEFLAYQRNYNLMTEKIPEPDIVIYLKADVEVLLQRINGRGRESEKSIPANYLSLLNELYEQYVSHHVHCPVLVIDANMDTPMEEYLHNTISAIANEITNLDLRYTSPGISEWVGLPQTAATLKAIDAESKLEKFLKDNPKLIAVAGNVGLGKSTLTAILERSLKLEGLYEAPEENPLLEKFLHDKPAYCYDLQRHFLQMRKELQIKGKSGECSYVMDRSLPEDILVFCRQFHQDGFLSKNQLDLLNAEFKKVCSEIESPDLMIVLTGRSSLAWNRIQQRGREMEMEGGWSQREIENLNKLYTNYTNDVERFGFHKGKVLEINVDKIDITNRIHIGYVLEGIYKILTEA